MANRWGRHFWHMGLLVSFKLKYVIGGLYFGNSRRLASVMVFLHFCMNTIKKIQVWTCLFQYVTVLFLFIGICGLVILFAYLSNWSKWAHCMHLGLLFQWPHYFLIIFAGYATHCSVQLKSLCTCVSLASPMRQNGDTMNFKIPFLYNTPCFNVCPILIGLYPTLKLPGVSGWWKEQSLCTDSRLWNPGSRNLKLLAAVATVCHWPW